MQTEPLHPHFGRIVKDVDLRDVTADHLFPEIRAAFETHSALLFQAQDMDDETHLRLAKLIGQLDTREAIAQAKELDFEIPEVSIQTDDGVLAADDLRTLDLQANMLWHTDSTF